MTSTPHTRKKVDSDPEAEDGVTTKEMSQAHKLRTRRTLTPYASHFFTNL